MGTLHARASSPQPQSPLIPLHLLQRLQIFPGKWGLLPDHRKRSKATDTEPLGSWLEHVNYQELFRAAASELWDPDLH